MDPSLTTPVMLGLMLVIFYVFLIRPQSQQAKRQKAFQEEIKKGAQVVTGSGIIGRVTRVDREGGTVTIETVKGTYLELTIGSISRELTEAKYGDGSGK